MRVMSLFEKSEPPLMADDQVMKQQSAGCRPSTDFIFSVSYAGPSRNVFQNEIVGHSY